MTRQTPLTNLQLELIKLFELDLSQEQLMEVKSVLSAHFASKARSEMDKLWQDNNWDEATMNSLLNSSDQ